MKALKTILYIIVCLLWIWLSISFIDIVIDNNLSDPQHFSWNLFELLF